MPSEFRDHLMQRARWPRGIRTGSRMLDGAGSTIDVKRDPGGHGVSLPEPGSRNRMTPKDTRKSAIRQVRTAVSP